MEIFIIRINVSGKQIITSRSEKCFISFLLLFFPFFGRRLCRAIAILSLDSEACCRLAKNICLISVGVVQLFRNQWERATKRTNEVKEQFVYLHIHIEPIKPRRSNNISLKMWMIITSHPWAHKLPKAQRVREQHDRARRMCCAELLLRVLLSYLHLEMVGCSAYFFFTNMKRYGTFLIHPIADIAENVREEWRRKEKKKEFMTVTDLL